MISMLRRVQPVVCASALGLAAMRCGGSTPPSNTPDEYYEEGGDDESGIIESGRNYQSTGSERVPVAGTDEPGMSDDIASETLPGGEAAPALSDAQIASIIELADSTEIEQAGLAQSKSKDARVLSIASMVIEGHRQSRKRQAELGLSTAGSPMFQTLSQQGRQTIAMLSDKQGEDFNRAYLQAQVEQNQRALHMLEHQLLPSARNPLLQAHLQKMRPMLRQHLEVTRDALEAR